jgi:hypothetical protein
MITFYFKTRIRFPWAKLEWCESDTLIKPDSYSDTTSLLCETPESTVHLFTLSQITALVIQTPVLLLCLCEILLYLGNHNFNHFLVLFLDSLPYRWSCKVSLLAEVTIHKARYYSSEWFHTMYSRILDNYNSSKGQVPSDSLENPEKAFVSAKHRLACASSSHCLIFIEPNGRFIWHMAWFWKWWKQV